MVSKGPDGFRISVFLSAVLCLILCLNCAPNPSGKSVVAPRTPVDDQHRIDINTAGEDELKALPGVGEKTAKKIIEHRKTYGDFRNPAELMLVDGISETRFLKMEARIKTMN